MSNPPRNNNGQFELTEINSTSNIFKVIGPIGDITIREVLPSDLKEKIKRFFNQLFNILESITVILEHLHTSKNSVPSITYSDLFEVSDDENSKARKIRFMNLFNNQDTSTTTIRKNINNMNSEIL